MLWRKSSSARLPVQRLVRTCSALTASTLTYMLSEAVRAEPVTVMRWLVPAALTVAATSLHSADPLA